MAGTTVNKIVGTKHVCLQLLIIAGLSFLGCHGILCFQCGETSSDGDCWLDYWGFVNDTKEYYKKESDNEPHRYIKDCTGSKPTWTKCMIETLSNPITGKYNLYHRGCTSGVNLTFEHSRFNSINANNETTCAYLTNKGLACYTFCDTDFCNGPQVPPNDTDPCAKYHGWDMWDIPDEDAACTAISLRAFLSLYIIVVIAAAVFHQFSHDF